MENNEKKDKYKDYLPQNRQKNSSLEPIRIISSILVCLLVIGLIAIAGIYFATGRNVIEESLTVKPRSYNMNIGETIALSNVYTSPNVVWETTNDNIEIKDGEVTALSEGSAYIIAVEDNKQVSDVLITVLPNDSNIAIDKHEITISSTETAKINVTQSSNKSETIQESTINNNNEVEEEENDDNEEYINGEIEYYFDYDNYIDEDLLLEDEEEDIIEEEPDEEDIEEIEIIVPSQADETEPEEKKITYESTNPDVATVDDKGKITPGVNVNGTTEVKATDEDGNTDHTVVTVITEPIKLENEPYILNIGEQKQINYSLDKSKYKESDVKWTSTNTNIATVNSNGVIKGIAEGKTTIIAKVDNISKSINVSVEKTIIKPTSISLSKTSLELKTGEKTSINATIMPGEATNKTITWKSSDTNVATVDSKGEITAKGAGTATITATTSNGLTQTLTVKVTQMAEKITLSLDKTSIKVGETAKITYNVLPSTTTDKSIKYTYDNNYISLDTNGKITAKKAGTTKITATSSSNPKVTATITLTIKSNSTTSSQKTYKSGHKEIDQMVNWMMKIARDDSHGYNQVGRSTLSKESPDVDCSSFVYFALERGAGISTKTLGGRVFTTSTMGSKLKNSGFKEITYSKSKLKYGDILWKGEYIIVKGKRKWHGHTEVYVGNGQTVGAHTCKPNKKYPKRSCKKKGDQDGSEVSKADAGTGWKKIFRYKG